MTLHNLFPIEPESEQVQPPIVYIREEPAWQYRHLAIDLQREPVPGEEQLNELGSEGWELVAMFTHEQSLHLYFKRLKDG